MSFAQLAGFVATILPICASAVALSETNINWASAFVKISAISTILTDIENAATYTACEVQFPFFIGGKIPMCTFYIRAIGRIESPCGGRNKWSF